MVNICFYEVNLGLSLLSCMIFCINQTKMNSWILSSVSHFNPKAELGNFAHWQLWPPERGSCSRSTRENTRNPFLMCAHVLVKTSPQGQTEALKNQAHKQPSKHFGSLSPSHALQNCLLLLSRNTVWVLTLILKYLRAASLSCFAVKWLPLHQWNNNWYDNRFIWASSSLRCYFVKWRVKAMAARRHFEFVCMPKSVCELENKAELRTKEYLYHLIIWKETEWYLTHSWNTQAHHPTTHYQPPCLLYLSAHPKPLPGSRSQLVTWTLKLSSLSLFLSFFLAHSLPLSPGRSTLQIWRLAVPLQTERIWCPHS